MSSNYLEKYHKYKLKYYKLKYQINGGSVSKTKSNSKSNSKSKSKSNSKSKSRNKNISRIRNKKLSRIIDNKNSENIDNMKIIKKLGSGNDGNVYMVQSATIPNKYYALKIEYMLSITSLDGQDSKIYRYKEFDRDVASVYPNMFLHIINYDIKNNCNDERTNKQQKTTNIINSCIRIVYTVIDGMLINENQSKMSDNEFYSMVIQLVYSVYLMHNKGYVHTDVNEKNIGYFDTKEKSIKAQFNNKIFNIPLFSKQYIIFDYGNVLHPKFKMTEFENTKYNRLKNLGDLDLIFFGYTLFSNYKLSFRSELENKLSILKQKPNYKEICEITLDPIHQIMYDDIKTRKFSQHPRIINLLLLYIKIGRDPELLISNISKLII